MYHGGAARVSRTKPKSQSRGVERIPAVEGGGKAGKAC